jgi:hypothetical protein
MAIALPLIAHLFAPLQGAVEWLSGSSADEHAPSAPEATETQPTRSAHGPARTRSAGVGGRPIRSWSGPTRATQGARPVRTVRVVEEDHFAAQTAAGRMVMSGRLADVCAELDRLVAQDASA